MKPLYAGVSAVALLSSLAVSSVALADDTATVQSVIVTGTRQTGVKAADSAAPVEVVGSEALKRTGSPDLTTALASSLPSFNVQGYGADTAALTVSAALRGLSPNETLVLVDGKRRHSTANLAVDSGSPYTGAAAVDLSYIPVAAIDHVEVLQDGAAAQYGTDAIAGVVNIILKKNAHGGLISATGGQYFEGDGEQGDLQLNRGFDLGEKGFFSLTGEVHYHDFSRQGGADRRFSNLDGSATSAISGLDAGIASTPGYPKMNNIYGDPRSTTYNLFFNTGYDLGFAQFYANGSYGHRIAEGYENYRKPSKVLGCTATTSPSGALIPGSFAYDSNGNITGCTTGSLSQPLPNGFSPLEAFNEDDFSFATGLKGEVEGWSWDLATTYGRNSDNVSTRNSANAQLYPDLQSVNTQPLVPQRNFADGNYHATEWTTTLDVTHDYAIGMATPLNVAAGVEFRRDSFGIGAGEPASYYGAGAQSFNGYDATDAGDHSRSNYAAYIDLAGNPIQPLHLDIAGRTEHYSDFGNTTVGKFTGRYDFTSTFAVRGTASTGFRAPTLAEEYYSGTNVSPSFAQVQLPSDSAAAASAGFAKLKPEKSTNFSLGFVAHPMAKLQITADVYQITVKDRIINSGFLLGSTFGCPLNSTSIKGTSNCLTTTNAVVPQQNNIVSQGVLNAITAHGNQLDSGISYAGITIFTNGADTRTQGAELTANYSSDFGDLGHVDWTLGLNYNETKLQKLYGLPSAVTSAPWGQTSLETPNAVDGLTTATPKEKIVASAFWSRGKWSANLRETVYGKTRQEVSFDGTGNPSAGGYAVIGTDITAITDLDVAYKLTPQIKLDLGANNLFDQKAPTVPNVSNGSGGVRPADGNNVYNEPVQFTPWGINGGYYYARVTFTF